MKTVSATRASRGFSEMLDRVALGETIRIERGGRTIAELRPASASTGRALRAALATVPPLDEEIEADIAAAMELVSDDENGSWPAG